MITLGFTINPTKMHVSNAHIGIKMLLLTKSIISSMVIPPALIKPRTPNPRHGSTPIAVEQIKTIKHDLCLDQPNLSQNIETMVSIKDMADVSAANKTKIKNTAAIT